MVAAGKAVLTAPCPLSSEQTLQSAWLRSVTEGPLPQVSPGWCQTVLQGPASDAFPSPCAEDRLGPGSSLVCRPESRPTLAVATAAWGSPQVWCVLREAAH